MLREESPGRYAIDAPRRPQNVLQGDRLTREGWEARRRGGGGDVETGDDKDAAVLVAQKDPRVLSSHARHGSCAGRRVDGAKLASGAIAASKRQVRARGGFSRFCVKSRRRPREPPMAGGDPVVRRDVLGAVAGAAQRPKRSE